ncbi:MAG TPA: DUF3754 domain-containing protein [Phycisphaerae bacterium]|nr:DUF3754 domain-containing protein [Phycisphaerae bacterium]
MPAASDVLSRDPTAGTAWHRPDDRFVPIRSCELAAAIADDTARFGPDASALASVYKAVEDVIEQEASALKRDLGDRYAAFNPDRETQPLADVKAARTPEGYADLEARLSYLLEKANFQRLDNVGIEATIRAARVRGLKVRVHPERVAQLGVWTRGGATTESRCRSLRHPVRGEQREVPVHRRLAIVTRLRDDPHIVLKLFKDIPVGEVEALLPHAEVAMSWLDRLKVVGGGAGVVGSTATKVLKLLGGLVYWSRLLWIVLIGAGILAFRTIMGYRSARASRDSQRTRNLYYQNLDNNAGVVYALISMIAQEEVKEGFLAYALCHAAGGEVASPEDLAARVEAYLAERFEATVCFDVADAIETIDRLALWADRAEFKVIPPAEAARQLGEHWRTRRSAEYHQTMIQGRNRRGASPAPA